MIKFNSGDVTIKNIVVQEFAVKLIGNRIIEKTGTETIFTIFKMSF